MYTMYNLGNNSKTIETTEKQKVEIVPIWHFFHYMNIQVRKMLLYESNAIEILNLKHQIILIILLLTKTIVQDILSLWQIMFE